MQSAHIPFDKSHLHDSASPCVTALLSEVNLLNENAFPSAQQLNRVVQRFQPKWQGPTFKGQSAFPATESRYYETIIGEDNVVPTREDNWHDLFNALIWVQFPKAKSLLNALHIKDIANFGTNPRTARRNRITHFDECGVVLAIEAGDSFSKTENVSKAELNQFLASLAMHEWHEVFIQQRDKWGKCVTPFIFGHANLEMMLSPFIGLTGKWLAVAVPSGFSKLDPWQQRSVLDNALVERIVQLDNFQQAPILKPIPLLGVPGWHQDQTLDFYNNKEYFRPVREGAKMPTQLPLWKPI